MVNYHTSTLLESSEHVFELIRYIFLAKVNAAPPYLNLRDPFLAAWPASRTILYQYIPQCDCAKCDCVGSYGRISAAAHQAAAQRARSACSAAPAACMIAAPAAASGWPVACSQPN